MNENPSPGFKPPEFKRDEDGRIIVTYSALTMFRSCRRKYWWRYIQQLVPAHIPITDARPFGTGIHGALELLVHNPTEPAGLADFLREFFTPDKSHDHFVQFMRASAMVAGYRMAWHREGSQADLAWEPIATEQAFQGDIVDPRTGRVSEAFVMEGKADGIVRVTKPSLWGTQAIDPGVYLIEHKTASRVDASYMAKLWCDDQIILYSHHLGEALDEPIAGVLYNVIQKTKLDHRQAETDLAFTQRKAAALAAAQAGEGGRRLRIRKDEPEEAFKARRVAKGLEEVGALVPIEAEPAEDYARRLASVYTKPGQFFRSALALDPRMVKDVREQVWEATIQHDEAMKREQWGKNKTTCWNFGKPCDFWEICTSFESPLVIEEKYRIREAHNEVNETEAKPF